MPDLPVSRLVAYGVAAMLVVGIGAWSLRGQDGQPATSATGAGASTPTRDAGASRADGVQVRAPAAAAPAIVHVAGAVRHPGVYRLADGARVKDAVHRAGGATSRADLDAINLAAKVADGQQVVVPRSAAAAPAGVAPGGAATAGGGDPAAPAAPVGLNAATLEQLQTLDGVGPATAQKIVAWRTEHGGFRSVDDLGQVPGIGPKRLAALREHVQP